MGLTVSSGPGWGYGYNGQNHDHWYDSDDDHHDGHHHNHHNQHQGGGGGGKHHKQDGYNREEEGKGGGAGVGEPGPRATETVTATTVGSTTEKAQPWYKTVGQGFTQCGNAVAGRSREVVKKARDVVLITDEERARAQVKPLHAYVWKENFQFAPVRFVINKRWSDGTYKSAQDTTVYDLLRSVGGTSLTNNKNVTVWFVKRAPHNSQEAKYVQPDQLQGPLAQNVRMSDFGYNITLAFLIKTMDWPQGWCQQQPLPLLDNQAKCPAHDQAQAPPQTDNSGMKKWWNDLSPTVKRVIKVASGIILVVIVSGVVYMLYLHAGEYPVILDKMHMMHLD